MNRTRRFFVSILVLVFLQIVLLGLYINTLKDFNDLSSIQQYYKYNNKKIILKKHAPVKSELNDNTAYTQYIIIKEKSTEVTRIHIQKLDGNVDLAPRSISLERKQVFKSAQFVQVEEAIKYKLTKKISMKNPRTLVTKPPRTLPSITGKVTKRITRLPTSKKQQTKQQTDKPLLTSFIKQKPVIQASPRHGDQQHHQPITAPLPVPTIPTPRNTSPQSMLVAVTKKPETYKTVLLYTPYFSKNPWKHLWFEEGMFFRENDGTICPHKCKITYQPSRMRHSHAVVFNADEIPSDLKDVAKHGRTFDQRWIYLSLENPLHSTHSRSYDGMFNWTSTYMRQSEVYMPYNNYKTITANEIPKDHFTRNYAKGKHKLIAWAVAHCNTKRDEIVKKLLKYVDVTVFGICSSMFNQNNQHNCPRGSEACRKTLRSYKFYLSFENALCSDYVTEKYWQTPLENELVPVVFGANYDAKNSIPGSFINVLDFPSVESLANYLKYLDKNDTAYNEYFSWKSRYKVENHSWRCMLCANLYNHTLPRKVITNFEQFWSPSARCQDSQLQAKVEKFLAA